MNLRLRLTLAVLGAAAPLLISFTWLRAVAHARAEEASLVQQVRLQTSGEGRARCETSPASWSRSHSWPRFRPRDAPPHGDPSHHRGPPPDEGPSPHRGPSHGEPPHDGPPPRREPPPGAPRREGGRGSVPAQVYPYAADLAASTEGAPSLEGKLLREAKAGVEVVSHRRRDQGVELLEVLVRMPWNDGPCAYVLAQHHGPPAEQVVLALLPGVLLPVGVAVLVMLLALGPVIRRIRVLAEQVRGAERSGYAAAVTPSGKDELTALAHAFNAASAEVRQQMAALERREAALRDFLNHTTHDLMTPLTVLTGHLAALAEGEQGAAPEPGTAEAAMKEAHYMASLIHNLGAAARLDAGAPQVQRIPVHFDEIVERAVARLGPIARRRGVALEHAVPPEPVRLLGDMTLLEQAVSNVVQNAVKHNRPGGHVAVVLDVSEDTFTLDVLDDGPGIPPEDLERLLNPGERGDGARTRDPEGLGLGLAITRRVADAHGLSLTLGPSEFGGLRVRLSGPWLQTYTDAP